MNVVGSFSKMSSPHLPVYIRDAQIKSKPVTVKDGNTQVTQKHASGVKEAITSHTHALQHRVKSTIFS